jgi:hypothetical protein
VDTFKELSSACSMNLRAEEPQQPIFIKALYTVVKGRLHDEALKGPPVLSITLQERLV